MHMYQDSSLELSFYVHMQTQVHTLTVKTAKCVMHIGNHLSRHLVNFSQQSKSSTFCFQKYITLNYYNIFKPAYTPQYSVLTCQIQIMGGSHSVEWLLEVLPSTNVMPVLAEILLEYVKANGQWDGRLKCSHMWRYFYPCLLWSFFLVPCTHTTLKNWMRMVVVKWYVMPSCTSNCTMMWLWLNTVKTKLSL